MQTNLGIQTTGVVAWNGTAAFPHDLRKHSQFAFSFEVTADIATDAVFNVQAAPASDADRCVAGTFAPVAEVPRCSGPAVPAEQATVTIPAGTKAGTVCAGTLPCKPDAFLQLAAASGDTANVSAVLLLHGPLI